MWIGSVSPLWELWIQLGLQDDSQRDHMQSLTPGLPTPICIYPVLNGGDAGPTSTFRPPPKLLNCEKVSRAADAHICIYHVLNGRDARNTRTSMVVINQN